MEIIHVTAELAPVAKVGGLGDVIHGLSRALAEKNQNVKVILPKYDTLDLSWVENLAKTEISLSVFFGQKSYLSPVWRGTVDGIYVIFIESEPFFERGKIYGCPDDIDRFNYFCLAALEFIKKFPPDALHIHDWHSAALAGLIKELQPEIKAKIVFTIHNLMYQGLCRAEDLDKLGWKSPQLKESGVYNLLKGGVIFADAVTTVSPNYAKEVLTPELGGNLQPTLKQYADKFSGILNGIDYDFWNPETDQFLPFHYSKEAFENKKRLKAELRRQFSLKEEHSPLVVSVTRLVSQKGPELIKACILRTLELGGQFILLGSTMDAKSEAHFQNLKSKLSDCPHVHFELTYNEKLSHLLYAGADLFLIPSIFEPCGLTQMISMRYGTVPLVRETGGLKDTVFEGKNGFTFGPPTAEAVHGALDRALETWYNEPDKWQELIDTGMKGNYSWEIPAEDYLKLYKLS